MRLIVICPTQKCWSESRVICPNPFCILHWRVPAYCTSLVSQTHDDSEILNPGGQVWFMFTEMLSCNKL